MQTLIDVPAFNATEPKEGLSDRYRFYSTRELIEPLLADSWEVTQAFQVQSRRYNPHGKHLVRLSHPKLQLGEERLDALIRNSHDGSSRFEFMLGAWRFICSNGIIVGASYASVSIQHTRAFEAVQERASQLIEHAPEVAAVFDAWKAKQLSKDEELALARAAASIRWPDLEEGKWPVDPRSLLMVRRDEDRGGDLWHTFNRLQEAIMVGGVETLQNARRTTRRIGSIDETLRINQGLWRAASGLYGATTDLVLPS